MRIAAGEPRGLLHGVRSFAQLLRERAPCLPCLEVRDAPDLPRRGFMLDVSRDRVPTEASLCALVEQLAALKLNVLQLYTEHTFAYPGHEAVWRDASPLTPEEIVRLDAFCAERGVELVPNQNGFGHMERWLRHPAYRALGELESGGSCLAPSEDAARFVALPLRRAAAVLSQRALPHGLRRDLRPRPGAQSGRLRAARHAGACTSTSCCASSRISTAAGATSSSGATSCSSIPS